MSGVRKLGVLHGSALYLGALIGPGLLLVPALAAQRAGAASIVAWAGLLVLSAPLAFTFAALGVRHPVAGGVSADAARDRMAHAERCEGQGERGREDEQAGPRDDRGGTRPLGREGGHEQEAGAISAPR